MLTQSDLVGLICERPQNFAWFLGAGASRSSGLPTAADVIWDMKRRYYCREENQDVSRQDIQIGAVRDRIQAFMDSRGFPALWSAGEYSRYFELIFGDDRERQRKYLRAILSEDDVTLSVGSRVLAALMSQTQCRAVFTTNFDSIVEKAFAAVGGASLSAYHLEGPSAAVAALDNEEYPIYCKLHGDFRYESLKNLAADLRTQNEQLAACFLNAGNRFGLIVAGYSGRDESVVQLMSEVSESPNPFPHGLFWTGLKGEQPDPSVESLLSRAREKGIDARFFEIETYDALMLNIWRSLPDRADDLDRRVRKTQVDGVSIPLSSPGSSGAIIRSNALPISNVPRRCLEVSVAAPMDWKAVRQVERESRSGLILTKADNPWCWGKREDATRAFGGNLVELRELEIPSDLYDAGNFHVKSFLEAAVSQAVSRESPLVVRKRFRESYVVIDSRAGDPAKFQPLVDAVGTVEGKVAGLEARVAPDHSRKRPVRWAECVRLSIEQKLSGYWLLLEPDIWISPVVSRRDASTFLARRRAGRFNKKANAVLDAWIEILLGTSDRNVDVRLRAFDDGDECENPAFVVGSRSGFSRPIDGRR